MYVLVIFFRNHTKHVITEYSIDAMKMLRKRNYLNIKSITVYGRHKLLYHIPTITNKPVHGKIGSVLSKPTKLHVSYILHINIYNKLEGY